MDQGQFGSAKIFTIHSDPVSFRPDPDPRFKKKDPDPDNSKTISPSAISTSDLSLAGQNTQDLMYHISKLRISFAKLFTIYRQLDQAL